MIVSNESNERQIAFEFEHYQATPSALWIINHNMNCHPSVTITDSAGTCVEGHVNYIDLNTLEVGFTGGFTGSAILR